MTCGRRGARGVPLPSCRGGRRAGGDARLRREERATRAVRMATLPAYLPLPCGALWLLRGGITARYGARAGVRRVTGMASV